MQPILDRGLFYYPKRRSRLRRHLTTFAAIVAVLPVAYGALHLFTASEHPLAAIKDRAASLPSLVESSVAAASAQLSSIDALADSFYRWLCPYVGSCAEEYAVTPAPIARSLAPASIPATAIATTSPTPQPSAPIQQTIVNQPVIERIIVREVSEPQQTALSSSAFETCLQQLEQSFNARLAANAASANATFVSAPVFAQAQRIDNLANVTISNPTITGGSVAASSISGTISNIIESALATFDSLIATEVTFTRATTTDLVAINATSTNFAATNASLTSATITNATTTSLAVTGSATSTFGGGILATRLSATATSTLAGLILDGNGLRFSTLDCSSFGNSGKLTTDTSGNVICGADQGGSGSTVGGSNTQVQFNDNGAFAGDAGFTYASSSARLTVTHASTTALSATNLYASAASSTSLTVSNLTSSRIPFASTAGLLADSAALTFDGTKFAATYASTTALTASTGYFATASTTNLLVDRTATTTNLAVTGLTSSLLSTNALGQVVATTSVGAGFITGSLGTINGTTLNRGDSITVTAASSTLLSDRNNWTGLNSFANATTTLLSGTTAWFTSFIGNLTGNVTGNASTATALETARTINGTSFDGTANITITAASSTLLSDNNTFSGLNTITHASSTALTVTGTGYFGAASTTALTVSGIQSAVLVAGASGTVAAATSQTCTNQFFRALSAAYVATCASIVSTDFADADWGDLSISGGVASLDADTVSDSEIDYATVTLADFTNDANYAKTTVANTWTALNQFAAGASTTQLSALDALYVGRTATTTIHGDGTASVLPYASTTALTVSGTAYFPGSGIWNSSGNVGIGTTTPYSKLTIWGGAGGTIFEAVTSASSSALSVSATGFGTTTLSGLNINGSATSTSNVGFNLTAGCFAVNGTCVGGGSGSGTVGSGTAGQFPYYAANGTTLTATSSIYLTTTGNVGIGTSSPYSTLSVSRTTQQDGSLPLFTVASTTHASLFTVLGNGNVGIGTSNPAQLLDVNGTAKVTLLQATSSSGQVASFTSSAAAGVYTTYIAGATAIGDIGSGLSLMSGGSTATDFGINSRVGSALVFGSANAERMRIDTSGNVGIGDTTPSFMLDVSGSVAFPGIDNTTGVGTVCIQSGGGELAYTTNNTCVPSDERLKKNIIGLPEELGLAAIKNLRPVEFDWRDATYQEKIGHSMGLIAQEVQGVIPALVTTNGTTTVVDDGVATEVNATLSVNYDLLSVLLVRAVQDIANLADSFREKLVGWFSDAANGIGDFFAKVGNFGRVNTDELCLGSTCVTETQLQALLAGAAAPQDGSAFPSPSEDTEEAPEPDTEAPVITIGGNNPATIQVGEAYSDLGATVTDNVDTNLGLKLYLNGALVSDIVIDTGTAGEHSIDYVATDNAGNTATSTRAVIVNDPSPAVSETL